MLSKDNIQDSHYIKPTWKLFSGVMLSLLSCNLVDRVFGSRSIPSEDCNIGISCSPISMHH